MHFLSQMMADIPIDDATGQEWDLVVSAYQELQIEHMRNYC